MGKGAFVGVYAPNVYLILGDSRAAFIDTAYGKNDEVRAQLAAWEAVGSPPVAWRDPHAPARRPHRRRGASARCDRRADCFES